MDFTDTKAITGAVVAIFTAIAGVIVTYAPGWMTQAQQNAIVTFITVVTPVVLGLIGLLHHNRAQVRKAALYALAANPGPDPVAMREERQAMMRA